jgi:hypothetical protein
MLSSTLVTIRVFEGEGGVSVAGVAEFEGEGSGSSALVSNGFVCGFSKDIGREGAFVGEDGLPMIDPQPRLVGDCGTVGAVSAAGTSAMAG